MAHISGILRNTLSGRSDDYVVRIEGDDPKNSQFAMVVNGQLELVKDPFAAGYKVVSCNNHNSDWCSGKLLDGCLPEDASQLSQRVRRMWPHSHELEPSNLSRALVKLNQHAIGFHGANTKHDVRSFTCDANAYMAVPSKDGGFTFYRIEASGANAKAMKVDDSATAAKLELYAERQDCALDLRLLAPGGRWSDTADHPHPAIALVANTFAESADDQHSRNALQRYVDNLNLGYKRTQADREYLAEKHMQARSLGIDQAGQAASKGVSDLKNDFSPVLKCLNHPAFGIFMAGAVTDLGFRLSGQQNMISKHPLVFGIATVLVSGVVGQVFKALKASAGNASGHAGEAVKDVLGSLTNCFSNNSSSKVCTHQMAGY